MTNKKLITTTKPKQKSTRFAAKRVFLTYSNCDLNISDVLKHLKKIIYIKEYLITQEDHKDCKSVHVHVYIESEIKIDTKSMRFFDIPNLNSDETDSCFHPNIQPVRKPQNVKTYIIKDITDIKDENKIIFSPNLEYFLQEPGKLLNINEVMIKLAKVGKIHDAMQLFEREVPGEFVRNHMRIEKSLRQLWVKSMGLQAKFSLSDFDVPFHILDQIEKAYKSKQSISIVGRSGIGKSQFIKTLLTSKFNENPLTINDFNSIDSFQVGYHTCIVFDDVNYPKGMTREEFIAYTDSENETTFNVKHSSKAIPANTPRLFLSNLMLESYVGEKIASDPAIMRRLTEILIPENVDFFKNQLLLTSDSDTIKK